MSDETTDYVAMETSSLFPNNPDGEMKFSKNHERNHDNDKSLSHQSGNAHENKETKEAKGVPLQQECTQIENEMSSSSSLMASASITSDETASSILIKFVMFSILFSANHGAVVSCLSLATARLGDLGTAQNSVLYLSYTLSALFGSTYVIKTYGPGKSIILGMTIYCIYTASYVVATAIPSIKEVAVITGGLIGGIGGGFLWTAQGSYFAQASEKYAIYKKIQVEVASTRFAGIFAGIYLTEEVMMRLFSTLMIKIMNWSWQSVFCGYTIIAIVATIFMGCIMTDFEVPVGQNLLEEEEGTSITKGDGHIIIESGLTPLLDNERKTSSHSSLFYKATVTFRMLFTDPKMKYMIPLSSAFALSSVFMISFVSGEVLRVSLDDENSTYIGILTSVTPATAGIMSVIFGFSAQKIGNGIILVIGCACFFMISILFILLPDFSSWNLALLIVVYGLQGIGRSTFEGALKAEFAIVFTDEKEGAFGNIIFQNGLVTTIGFYLIAHLSCPSEGRYCIMYSDGLLHNVLVYEILILVSSVLAVLGYFRAKQIYKKEIQMAQLEAVSPDNVVV